MKEKTSQEIKVKAQNDKKKKKMLSLNRARFRRSFKFS